MSYLAYAAEDLQGVIHSVVIYNVDTYSSAPYLIDQMAKDMAKIKTSGVLDHTTCHNAGFDKPFLCDPHVSEDLSRVTCLPCVQSLEGFLRETGERKCC